MATRYRKMIVRGDHLDASESGPPWLVLWDIAPRPGDEWSTVRTQSEASALERAAHFLKLGFIVHAIKDPSGTIAMNAEQVAARCGPSESPKPRRRSGVVAPSAEKSAHDILRGFVQDFHAMPGRMLMASAMHALLAPQGIDRAEFIAAVTYAEEHGWLIAANDTLTLTQAGYGMATA